MYFLNLEGEDDKMNNILSYLKWRGDISFLERPFNEVDNLILSEISYIDFDGIVPGIEENKFIRIKEVYDSIITENDENKFMVRSLVSLPLTFLKEMALSTRYGSAKLFNYKELYDEKKHIQFAALHIELDDKTVYISFRGTDQTIMGWREDFHMSFQTIPSQREAVKYLEQTMIATAKIKYRIGGHSKGGNLAVYAAMMCTVSLKKQIIEIYNNDGPGFSSELVHSLKYEEIRDRITRIIPQFSVIGMLFSHDSTYKIVKSYASGIMQHDAKTWCVDVDHFLEKEDLIQECKKINKIVDTLIKEVTIEQRKIFIKNFFDTLEASGAKYIDEIVKGGINGIESILTTMVKSEKNTRFVFSKLIQTLIVQVSVINLWKLIKTRSTLYGGLIVFVGLFFMQFLQNALEILSTAAIFVVFIFSIKRQIYRIAMKDGSITINKWKLSLYILIIPLVTFFIVQRKIYILTLNIILSIIFCFYGLGTLNSATKSYRGHKFWWFPWGRAIVTIILGIVIFLLRDKPPMEYYFITGALMVMEGLRKIVVGMYEKYQN